MVSMLILELLLTMEVIFTISQLGSVEFDLTVNF